MPEPLIVSIRGRAPSIHAERWVAPNASLIGQVNLAARSSVWYGATLRAEAETIEVGPGTNIQDGATIHVDPGFPVTIGANVSVGHNVVLHGCEIEDGCLIAMNSAHSGAATTAHREGHHQGEDDPRFVVSPRPARLDTR